MAIATVTILAAALRLARAVVVTYACGTLAFGAIAPAVAGSRLPLPEALVALGADRSAPVALSGGLGAGTALVSLEVDGLRLGSVPASGTVGDVLEQAGISLGSGDRLSASPAATIVPGMRIAVDRGFPVTLIDGGRATEARSQRTTVGGFLAALAVNLGADDSVASALDQSLAPWDVVKVVRVTDRETTEVVPYPFRARTVEDPTLDVGRSVIDVRGVNGEVSETYLVRYVDGVESDRTLLSATVLRSPVTEVRRVGSRPVAPPVPPAEIDRIIRVAAARYGADADQLLRVAYCESRFNPLAYNPNHGDSGLFQFIPATWAANSVRAGFGGASPFDPVASANVAAWMFSRGQAWQWTCK